MYVLFFQNMPLCLRRTREDLFEVLMFSYHLPCFRWWCCALEGGHKQIPVCSFGLLSIASAVDHHLGHSSWAEEQSEVQFQGLTGQH